ncbi:MAG: ABC transporter substrate-binding protein [Clostridiales bacterium]|jgi:ABC-type nitrate/sulfonate/bicarbonate transport system substrate-binding protein|nr:ABC transporter substrate-binding protein [Clostridiales bacterium]
MKKSAMVLTLILALTLAACAKSNTPADTPPSLAAVTLVLDYLPNTNHTGFYVARDMGYFTDAGLDVTIIEPADNTVTTLIATGNGDFGISYQEDVTYARAREEPMPIRAVAAIIQHNTSAFAAYAPKNITRPRDFAGKTYAGWGSPAEEAVLRAMMRADGADPDSLKYVVGAGGYAALSENVDIMWFYRAWDGILSARAGIDVNYIDLAKFDARLDYYTPVVIASEVTLKDRPDMVKTFLAATKRGYDYAIANPEDAAKILSKATPEYELDMLVESQNYLAAQYIADAPRWGEMKASVWEGYTEFMTENGLITKSVTADDCMTNAFLP